MLSVALIMAGVAICAIIIVLLLALVLIADIGGLFLSGRLNLYSIWDIMDWREILPFMLYFAIGIGMIWVGIII